MERPEVCPICLDVLGEKAIQLSVCKHFMHEECLKPMMGQKCPLCKRPQSDVTTTGKYVTPEPTVNELLEVVGDRVSAEEFLANQVEISSLYLRYSRAGEPDIITIIIGPAHLPQAGPEPLPGVQEQEAFPTIEIQDQEIRDIPPAYVIPPEELALPDSAPPVWGRDRLGRWNRMSEWSPNNAENRGHNFRRWHQDEELIEDHIDVLGGEPSSDSESLESSGSEEEIDYPDSDESVVDEIPDDSMEF